MIVNAKKFYAIVLDKKKSDRNKKPLIIINNQQIKIVLAVELIDIQLDDRLNLNNYISNICRSPANQLSAFITLEKYLNFSAKKFFITSYVVSNFNYYSLVWIFSTAKSFGKIGGLHKKAPRFLCNYYTSSHKILFESMESCNECQEKEDFVC